MQSGAKGPSAPLALSLAQLGAVWMPRERLAHEFEQGRSMSSSCVHLDAAAVHSLLVSMNPPLLVRAPS